MFRFHLNFHLAFILVVAGDRPPVPQIHFVRAYCDFFSNFLFLSALKMDDPLIFFYLL
jgi:hypothetical protein